MDKEEKQMIEILAGVIEQNLRSQKYPLVGSPTQWLLRGRFRYKMNIPGETLLQSKIPREVILFCDSGREKFV